MVPKPYLKKPMAKIIGNKKKAVIHCAFCGYFIRNHCVFPVDDFNLAAGGNVGLALPLTRDSFQRTVNSEAEITDISPASFPVKPLRLH